MKCSHGGSEPQNKERPMNSVHFSAAQAGGEHVPQGTFHGGERVPQGTFHGGERVPQGTFHGGERVPQGTFH